MAIARYLATLLAPSDTVDGFGDTVESEVVVATDIPIHLAVRMRYVDDPPDGGYRKEQGTVRLRNRWPLTVDDVLELQDGGPRGGPESGARYRVVSLVTSVQPGRWLKVIVEREVTARD